MAFAPFTNITSRDLAEFIRARVEERVVIALPSIHEVLAEAVVDVAERLKGRVAVVIDPSEDVYRLGFGKLEALEYLQSKGVPLLRREGLRLGCVLMDDVALFLAPVAHLVEAESEWTAPRINAVPVHPSQAEAYLRAIAEHAALDHALVGPAKTSASEPKAELVHPEELQIVKQSLKDAPPANFPLARQTRVFNAHLQYVDIELRGCSLGRRKYAIPKTILPMEGDSKVKDRLEASLTLIPESAESALDPVRDKVEALRKDVAKDLGKPYGRVLLKSSKEGFEKEVESIRADLKKVQAAIDASLQAQLQARMEEVVGFCLPHAQKHIPEALRKLDPNPSKEDVERFVRRTVKDTFPTAKALIGDMTLSTHYKDMTFETLNQDDFIQKLEEAYPHRDWKKTYQESLAVKAEASLEDDDYPF